MKKLMVFSLISAALMSHSVCADNIKKERVIPIEVKVSSSVDIKMTTIDGKSITKIKMLPDAKKPGYYTFSQDIEITTLGMNGKNRLNVLLGKALELINDDQQLANIKVHFNGKELNVASPTLYNTVNNKVSGALKIEASASSDTKKGIFKGDLVLQLEEVA
ncbi:CS1 type fimbrial major subunit [Candidatus Regiella insecticola]|nr:CS1 type fimbrial major subunit [Candidatus Regiella insecticola]